MFQPLFCEEIAIKTDLRDVPVFNKHVRCELAAGEATLPRDVELRVVAEIPRPLVKRFRADLDDAAEIALRERIALPIVMQKESPGDMPLVTVIGPITCVPNCGTPAKFQRLGVSDPLVPAGKSEMWPMFQLSRLVIEKLTLKTPGVDVACTFTCEVWAHSQSGSCTQCSMWQHSLPSTEPKIISKQYSVPGC